MNIKHFELEIPTENPFANCKLGRKKYAEILTNIINSYPDGFVLAVNNKWGTGKTTFVKMWEQDLKNKDFQTVYFNAWENDFEDNPLTALMGELKTLITKDNEKEFKSTLKKAAIITKNVGPVIVKAIADKYISIDGVKEAIIGVTKGLSDVFENEVDEYAKKKKSISDFRNSLSEFVANTSKGKPLVFIVDELDRCRPNYAVSILEQIKHFFSVPNVVFVISIDKIQLCNAVKGVYGNDNIDAEEYLRRFIDIEYSIPEPEPDIFYEYLYNYFNFKDFFDFAERKKYRELLHDGKNFLKVCKLLFNNKNIPLRQQEKIFGLSRLALRSFNSINYVVPHIFLFLVYIKITNSRFYENMKNKSLTILQVQQEFFKIVEINLNEDIENELLWLEAYLTNYYNNYIQSEYHRKLLFERDTEKGVLVNKLLIDSIINKASNNTLLQILESIHKGRREGELSLEYFINKIELLENLKV